MFEDNFLLPTVELYVVTNNLSIQNIYNKNNLFIEIY